MTMYFSVVTYYKSIKNSQIHESENCKVQIIIYLFISFMNRISLNFSRLHDRCSSILADHHILLSTPAFFSIKPTCTSISPYSILTPSPHSPVLTTPHCSPPLLSSHSLLLLTIPSSSPHNPYSPQPPLLPTLPYPTSSSPYSTLLPTLPTHPYLSIVHTHPYPS